MRPWAASLGSKLVQMETSILPHRAVNSKRFHAPMAHCKPVLQRLERMALPSSKSPIQVFSLPTITVRCMPTTKSPQVGGCWFHPHPQLHGLTSVKCTTYMNKAMSFTSEPTTVFIALTSIQTFQANNLFWLKTCCTATPSLKLKRLGPNSCLRPRTRGLLASTTTTARGSAHGIRGMSFLQTKSTAWHQALTCSTSYLEMNWFDTTGTTELFRHRLALPR